MIDARKAEIQRQYAAPRRPRTRRRPISRRSKRSAPGIDAEREAALKAAARRRKKRRKRAVPRPSARHRALLDDGAQDARGRARTRARRSAARWLSISAPEFARRLLGRDSHAASRRSLDRAHRAVSRRPADSRSAMHSPASSPTAHRSPFVTAAPHSRCQRLAHGGSASAGRWVPASPSLSK